MRILHVVHDLPPEDMAGTPILTWQLATAQARAGAEVHVFRRAMEGERADGATWSEEREGVRIHHVQHGKLDWAPLRASYDHPEITTVFRRLLAEIRPDVVHVQHLLGLGIGVLDAALADPAVTVVSLHDFWFTCPMGQRVATFDGTRCATLDFARCGPCVYGASWITPSARTGLRARYQQRVAETPGRPLRRPRAMVDAGWDALRALGARGPEVDPFARRLAGFRERLQRADLVIGTSAFITDLFRRECGLSDDRLLFLANGMDESTVTPFPSPPREGPLAIGFIGSLIETKGVHVLLEAFLSVADRLGGATLEIHGAPNLWSRAYAENLEARAVGHEAGDRVRFHGRFDNRELGRIHATLDLLVVPSVWYENSPLVLNEAAMTGTPVVVSDEGGMREFVETTGFGRSFHIGDPSDLARVLLELSADPEAARALGAHPPPIKPIARAARQTLALYEGLREGTWRPPPRSVQRATRGGILEVAEGGPSTQGS